MTSKNEPPAWLKSLIFIGMGLIVALGFALIIAAMVRLLWEIVG